MLTGGVVAAHLAHALLTGRLLLLLLARAQRGRRLATHRLDIANMAGRFGCRLVGARLLLQAGEPLD